MWGKRICIFGLMLSFSAIYLEWGGGNHCFIFQLQQKILTEPRQFIANFTHPIILAGFVGQVFLFLSLFVQKQQFRMVAYGLILLGIPVFLIVLSGILSANFRIFGSCLPFLLFAYLSLYRLKRNAS